MLSTELEAKPTTVSSAAAEAEEAAQTVEEAGEVLDEVPADGTGSDGKDEGVKVLLLLLLLLLAPGQLHPCWEPPTLPGQYQ